MHMCVAIKNTVKSVRELACSNESLVQRLVCVF